jgi:capsular polysaccharide biosynthesis protein
MLQMSVISGTRIIAVRVTGPDPTEAMNIANALAEKCVSEIPKLMETPQPHIAEYAIIPVNPSSPSLSRNAMIGALIGMISILGILTIRFLMDDTFKYAEDIEREFGVMPLTVIPEGKIEGAVSDKQVKAKRRKKKDGKRGH